MSIVEHNKHQDTAAEFVFAEGFGRASSSLGLGVSSMGLGLAFGPESLGELDDHGIDASPLNPGDIFEPPRIMSFGLDGAPIVPMRLPEGGNSEFSVELEGVTVVPVGIPGGLIFDPPIAGDFGAAGDTDAFFIDVDPGQKLTVVFQPDDAAIQGQITLFDPGGVSLGTIAAIAPGDALLLQNLPGTGTTSGTYQLDATSVAGTGNYTVEFILNASVEQESITGQPNDTIATAQNIDDSAIALLNGADRLAVLGETGEGITDTVVNDIGFSGTGNTANVLTYDSAQGQFLLIDRSQNLHSLAATGGAATFINANRSWVQRARLCEHRSVFNCCQWFRIASD